MRRQAPYRAVVRLPFLTDGQRWEDLIPAIDLYANMGADAVLFPDPMESDNHTDRFNRCGYGQVANRISRPCGGQESLDRAMGYAKNLGLHPVVDLVLGQSSDQHEWYSHGTEHPDLYWRVTLPNGSEHTLCFVNLGWKPKFNMASPAVRRAVMSTIVPYVSAHGASYRYDHLMGSQDPLAILTDLQAAGLFGVAEHVGPLPEDAPESLMGDSGFSGGALLNEVCHNGDGVRLLQADYKDWTGDNSTFEETATRNTVRELLRFPELQAVGAALGYPEASPRKVAEWLATIGRGEEHFYRTYIRPGQPISERDRRAVAQSTMPDDAKQRFLEGAGGFIEALIAGGRVKGLEDTTLDACRDVPGFGEVGTSRRTLSPAAFHQERQLLLSKWPGTWWKTANHDMRMSPAMAGANAYASWIADDYVDSLRLQRDLVHSRGHNPQEAIGGHELRDILVTWAGYAPDCPVTWLLQELRKGFRQAKRITNWAGCNNPEPNPEWEKQMMRMVLSLSRDAVFMDTRNALAARLREGGMQICLSKEVLKIFAGGVAAFYAGAERAIAWGRDPQNRRDKGIADIRARLERISAGTPLNDWADKMINLTWVCLQALKKHPQARTSFPEAHFDLPPWCVGMRCGPLLAVASIDPGRGKWVPSGVKEDYLSHYSHQGLYRLS